MHEKIGEHPLWTWPVVGAVHGDTILTTWVVMLATLAFFYYLGMSYRTNKVNKTQATFEGIINYLSDLGCRYPGTLGRTLRADLRLDLHLHLGAQSVRIAAL